MELKGCQLPTCHRLQSSLITTVIILIKKTCNSETICKHKKTYSDLKNEINYQWCCVFYSYYFKIRCEHCLRLRIKLKTWTHIWVWYGILSLNCIGLKSKREMNSFNYYKWKSHKVMVANERTYLIQWRPIRCVKYAFQCAKYNMNYIIRTKKK